MEKFVTSRGVEIEFLPIPPAVLDQFNAANPEPEPPYYDMPTATGVTQKIALDAKSLSEKPEQFTPEQHAAFKAYQSQLAAQTQKFIRFFCLRGVKVNASMADWIEEQTFIGLPVPENKAERKYAWLTSEILSTVDDYKTLMLGILQASGVPDHLLAQVADSFRGDIPGHTDQPAGAAGQPMEGIPEIPGSVGSSQVGDPPQQIRQAAPAGSGRAHPILADARHNGGHRSRGAKG